MPCLLSDEPKNGDVTDAPIITLYLTSGQTDILAPIVPVRPLIHQNSARQSTRFDHQF